MVLMAQMKERIALTVGKRVDRGQVVTLIAIM
jgi:hypothetical protein